MAIVELITTAINAVEGILTSNNKVRIAEEAVNNTKVQLKIEQEKGETAEALAQIDLLKERLKLQEFTLATQRDVENQKSKSSNMKFIAILIFVLLITFLIFRYLKPDPVVQAAQPQTILLQG